MEKYTSNIIIVILLITVAVLVDYVVKLRYYLRGRLTGTHTLQNLLTSGTYISNESDKNEFIRYINKIIDYSFYEQKSLRVELQNELEIIALQIQAYNIINASKIRLRIVDSSDDIQADIKIPPFMLVTVIENACQYGNVTSGNIQIDLSYGKYNTYKIEISGYVLPSIKDIRKPKKDHGIDFVKQRLSFLHQHFHTNLKEEEYIFIKDNKLCILIPR
jgi:LytS/YehU family sensor histidine kinase